MRHRARGSIAAGLALALAAPAACGSSAEDSGSDAGDDIHSDAGGSTSSSGGSTSGSSGSTSSGSSGGTSSGSGGGSGGSAGSSGGSSGGSSSSTSSGGTGSDGGMSSSGALPPAPVYHVTPAPDWDAVFNNTGHNGDGFQWIPLGTNDRQALGTASTNSVVLFNDSNYAGHFFDSTAGEYTGVTPDTSKMNWVYGTNGQKADYNNLWDTTRAESGYGGTVAWNLVNNYGMSGIRGTGDTHDTEYMKMWLSDHSPSSANGYIVLDSYAVRSLGKMALLTDLWA